MAIKMAILTEKTSFGKSLLHKVLALSKNPN